MEINGQQLTGECCQSSFQASSPASTDSGRPGSTLSFAASPAMYEPHNGQVCGYDSQDHQSVPNCCGLNNLELEQDYSQHHTQRNGALNLTADEIWSQAEEMMEEDGFDTGSNIESQQILGDTDMDSVGANEVLISDHDPILWTDL